MSNVAELEAGEDGFVLYAGGLGVGAAVTKTCAFVI